MKNYVIYSINGNIVNKHVENENEPIHYFLAFPSNEKELALFEIVSEPKTVKIEV